MQVAGIQFDLIIIRLGRGIAAEHVEAQTKSAATHINLRNLEANTALQPSVAVSAAHDTNTTVSHELRMVPSDVALKKCAEDDRLHGVKLREIGGEYV